MIGKIIKLTGGFYYIKSGDEVFETRARGNFRHSKVEPIVGDDVEFKYEEKTYVTIFGKDKGIDDANKYSQRAIECIKDIDNSQPLIELTNKLLDRKY